MELVYLWVEDYKNIYKQGFNFSPRFECEFKDGELIICDKTEKDNKCKNKDYIEKFFGENINVTAIVGKNGSGKSSLIRYIEDLFMNFHKTYLYIIKKNTEIFIISNDTLIKINYNHKYTMTKHNNDIFNLCTYNSEMPYPYEHRKIFFEQKDFFTFNMQKKHINEMIHLSIKNTSNLNNIDFIFEPKTMTIEENHEYKNMMINTILEVLKDLGNFKNFSPTENLVSEVGNEKNRLDKSKIFRKILINIVSSDASFNPNDISNLNDSFFKDEKNISDEILYIELIKNIQENLKTTLTKEELLKHDIFNIYLLYKLINKHLGLEEFLIRILLKNPYLDINSEFIKILFDKECVRDINKYLYEPLKYITFLQLKSSNEKDFNNKLLFNDYYSFFTFDFMDKDGIRAYSDLSHGEKTFYSQILNIHSELMKNKNDFLICLDEPELSLHPKWQKDYLQKFIKAVKDFKNIHLVITSHSPFILSDLPKENVIFLDTYEKEKTEKDYPNLKIKDLKDGNCINVSEHIDINPFGANIHTLLSDGFFMDDGLMGEFAKGKIQNVINFINNKKSNLKKEEIFPIIELIGEPFLQHKLKEQYFEKYPKERNIDDEISTLKQKLKELENVKNSK